MSHLPFDPEKLTPENKSIYERMSTRRRAQGAPFDGPYAALMNHPQLCSRIEELGFYLKFQGHLPREIYQFIVLSVARETGASFEWADHVDHARKSGVPEEVIGILERNGLIDESFPPHFLLAAQILRETLRWKNVPEEIQNQFINLYGKEGYVEIVVLSGFYQMFSAINQGFDIKNL